MYSSFISLLPDYVFTGNPHTQKDGLILKRGPAVDTSKHILGMDAVQDGHL